MVSIAGQHFFLPHQQPLNLLSDRPKASRFPNGQPRKKSAKLFHHAKIANINVDIIVRDQRDNFTLFSLFTSMVARLHNRLIFAKSPSSAAHRSAVKTKSSLS